MTQIQPHECDFCSGTVRPTVANSESIRVRNSVVLVEGAMFGKCDRCGHRYWPAEVLKRAECAAEHPEQASRIISIPVIAA